MLEENMPTASFPCLNIVPNMFFLDYNHSFAAIISTIYFSQLKCSSSVEAVSENSAIEEK